MEMDFNKGIICWALVAIPLSLISIVLYRRKVISAEVLIWVCTPVVLVTSNLVAVWRVVPGLKPALKLLIAVSAMLLVMPFLVVGELIRRSHRAR